MTPAEVTRLFKQIVLAYPMFRVPEEMAKEQVAMWHQHLKDVPYETALRILGEHIATERFPPTIADFRSRIDDLDNVRRQKEEAESFIAQVELWKQRAAPPPDGLRARIISMTRGDGA